MHIANVLTQQQFQRMLFHSGYTPEDSNYVVTVGTLGGLLGLLLLVVVVAVIVGTCTGLCVRHRRQSKATREDMWGMKPNHVVLIQLLYIPLLYKL